MYMKERGQATVLINGEGAIGRPATRGITPKNTPDLKLIHVNSRSGISDESIGIESEIYQEYPGYGVEDNEIVTPYGRATLSMVDKIEEIPVVADIALETTGADKDPTSLSRRFVDNEITKYAILSCPWKGDNIKYEQTPMFIFQVNHQEFNPEIHKVISAGSCTTTALAITLKGMGFEAKDYNGINALSVHSFTSSNNLEQRATNKRRGFEMSVRGNMIPSSTGAAKALKYVMPETEGMVTASALRVDAPRGSLIHLNASFKKQTSVKELIGRIHENLREDSNLADRLTMAVGDKSPSCLSTVLSRTETRYKAAIIDGNSMYEHTQKPDGSNSISMNVWYPNVDGYSQNFLMLANYVAKEAIEAGFI